MGPALDEGVGKAQPTVPPFILKKKIAQQKE